MNCRINKGTHPAFLLTLAVALALSPLLTGCSEEDSPSSDAAVDLGHTHDGAHAHDGSADDLDAEACAHLTSGPFVDAATGTDPASAGAVGADHQAYRVTLEANAAGMVRFAADGPGDLQVFMSADVPLVATDDQGAPIAIEETEDHISACDAIAVRHTLELVAAGTIFLELGPVAAATTVTLVLEHGAHEHH